MRLYRKVFNSVKDEENEEENFLQKNKAKLAALGLSGASIWANFGGARKILKGTDRLRERGKLHFGNDNRKLLKKIIKDNFSGENQAYVESSGKSKVVENPILIQGSLLEDLTGVRESIKKSPGYWARLGMTEKTIDAAELDAKKRGGFNPNNKLEMIHILKALPKSGPNGDKEFDVAAEVVAHEIGHSKFRKTNLGKIIGKFRHSKIPGFLAPAVSIGTGIKAALDERKGKYDHSFLNKYGGALTAIATTVPESIDEIAASKKGLDMLKAAGASDEFLKNSKNTLGRAYATYALKEALKVARQPLTRYAAKKAAHKFLDWRDRKKAEKEEID